ncbi:GIY-YIG nuclease family protein [Alteromonas flava]|uniref:GIY-YIG nuclease family protein n=1 Tax=Alteromonas flava TaxID=2048003 RepID=UPI0013DB83E0
MMKQPCVYIITNTYNTTVYIGVTGNLIQRIYQHKTKQINGFSKNYNLQKLVYFEQFTSMENAIQREKRLKNWRRAWKDELIASINPGWEDLYEILLG